MRIHKLDSSAGLCGQTRKINILRNLTYHTSSIFPMLFDLKYILNPTEHQFVYHVLKWLLNHRRTLRQSEGIAEPRPQLERFLEPADTCLDIMFELL